MSENHLTAPRPSPFGLNGNTYEAYMDALRVAGSHSGEINHTEFLSDDIGSFMNPDVLHVIFVVDGEKFSASRMLLAVRSEYFRALLYGGMKESEEDEIVLKETNGFAFRMLLRYIYTAKLTLRELQEEQVMEILGLAHKYGIVTLQDAIADYLKAVLNSKNFCTIFSTSQLYSLNDLTEHCLHFADLNATEMLASQGFLQLPLNVVTQLLERDSFCASEIIIFFAIRDWVKIHPEMQATPIEKLMKCLRLSFISERDLLNIVRPTGLFSHDVIQGAIEEQSKRITSITNRGILTQNTNVATAQLGALVISGKFISVGSPKSSLCKSFKQIDWTWHKIGDEKGITVQLGHRYIINKIILQLNGRESSYYVEVSVDRCDWVRVIDHSKYLCCPHQYLYFEPRVVRYIRIVGTSNRTASGRLLLKDMEALHCSDQFNIDPKTTLLIPTANVATIENEALVIEGVIRNSNALLNGQNFDYERDNGYTCHQLNSGAITIQLPQPYMIRTMRFLLWDRDDLYYSYYVEVSTDRKNWTEMVDRRDKQCRSWQLLELAAPVPVVFVKIVGTYSSANDKTFRCVHFECPADSVVPWWT